MAWLTSRLKPRVDLEIKAANSNAFTAPEGIELSDGSRCKTTGSGGKQNKHALSPNIQEVRVRARTHTG